MGDLQISFQLFSVIIDYYLVIAFYVFEVILFFFLNIFIEV